MTLISIAALAIAGYLIGGMIRYDSLKVILAMLGGVVGLGVAWILYFVFQRRDAHKLPTFREGKYVFYNRQFFDVFARLNPELPVAFRGG
jgi:hypothetical protein